MATRVEGGTFPNLIRLPFRSTLRGNTALTRRRLPLHLVLGCLFVGLMVIAAIFAPILSPANPNDMDGSVRLHAPSINHPFGTDEFGRDLFSRVLFGARLDLQMAIATALLAALPGVLLGLSAGYRGGWLDQVLSRIMDAWLAIPAMLVAIVMIARLGASTNATIIALAISGVPTFFRLARNETLSIQHSLYVEAAVSLGASPARILLQHILPNMASPLIVLTTLRLATMLLAIGGLSFIGLGAQPPAPEWGALLAAGRDSMDTAWWLTVFPGLALTIGVLGFNLFGDGLRDLFAHE